MKWSAKYQWTFLLKISNPVRCQIVLAFSTTVLVNEQQKIDFFKDAPRLKLFVETVQEINETVGWKKTNWWTWKWFFGWNGFFGFRVYTLVKQILKGWNPLITYLQKTCGPPGCWPSVKKSELCCWLKKFHSYSDR